MRMKRHILYYAGLVALAACSWGRFDDLKQDTGVALADRPGNLTGTIGIGVAAVTPLSGGTVAEAGAFVTSATTPSGLVRFSILANGEINSTDAAEASQTGGDLNPIKPTTAAQAIAGLGSDRFVVGVPGGNQVVSFDNALTGFAGTGSALIDPANVRTQFGSALAVGSLDGVGDSRPDIVVVASERVYVIPDGDSTKQVTVCSLRQPQPPSFALGNGSVFAKNVAIATFGGSTKIVVSGETFTTPPDSWVKIMDPPTSTDTSGPNAPACPDDGFRTGSSNAETAFAVTVGDVNGNGTPDIITGSGLAASGSTPSKVCVYLDVTIGSTPTCTELPSFDDIGAGVAASPLRGARLLVDQFDTGGGTASTLIAVGDPGANIGGKSGGAVALYKMNGATPQLVQTLWVSGADGSENFGRDIAAIPFNGKPGRLLAVALKDRVAVYFKVLPGANDPRN
jgi:hypothetical protein